MAGFCVGLTGGIASGKSAAEAAFARAGLAVVDADAIARALVEPGQPALDEIVRQWGEGVLLADGHLDRAALRRKVFADAAARKVLEGILHPRIRARLQQCCHEAPGSVAIATIPLLAEGGGRAAYPWLQRIAVVDVARETQHQRLMQRDGIDAALADSMLAAQASRAARLAIADDVLANEADLATLAARVTALAQFYCHLAAQQAAVTPA